MPRKKKGDDFLGKAVNAFLQSKNMKAATDYATRGRKFQDLKSEELERMYTDSFKQWVLALSPSARAIMEDCQSEYSLRGLPTPENPEIEEAMNVLIQRTTAAVEELKEDPKKFREANEELAEDIAEELASIQSETEN